MFFFKELIHPTLSQFIPLPLLYYLMMLFLLYFATFWPSGHTKVCLREKWLIVLSCLCVEWDPLQLVTGCMTICFLLSFLLHLLPLFLPPVPDLPSLLLKLLSCKIERTAGRIKNETGHHERTNLEEGHCCWLHLKRWRQSVSHVGPGKVKKSRDEDQRQKLTADQQHG